MYQNLILCIRIWYYVSESDTVYQNLILCIRIWYYIRIWCYQNLMLSESDTMYQILIMWQNKKYCDTYNSINSSSRKSAWRLYFLYFLRTTYALHQKCGYFLYLPTRTFLPHFLFSRLLPTPTETCFHKKDLNLAGVLPSSYLPPPAVIRVGG